MGCRFTINGKAYEEPEFKAYLRALPPAEAARYMPSVKSMPVMPFEKTWQELTMKRMIRYAAENGFDKIAWTTGEQQADRYDLSQQVSAVKVERPGTNSYTLLVKQKGGRRFEAVANEIPETALADHVGKELAQKIVDDKLGIGGEKTYSGLDLKVGGEGMKGFYDKILPAFVNKYVKKWGAKVGTTKITSNDEHVPQFDRVERRGDGYAAVTARGHELTRIHPTEEAAMAELGFRAMPVHAVDITDAMKDSVLHEGQPLFARRQPTGILFQDYATQPQPGVMDYLKSSNLSLTKRLKGALSKKALQQSLDEWRTGFQDRYLPLLRVQRVIEQQLGRPLSEDERAYLQEELSSGKKGAQLEDLSENLVRPLLTAMHDNKISLDQLEMFLMARHAPERNAHISSINDRFNPGEGSGMTDAEAALVMQGVDASGKRAELEALAALVDKIIAFDRDTRLAGGLRSQGEHDALKNMFTHYVPLRGWEELDPELEADRPRTGSAFGASMGKENRTAFGRSSKAVDILAYAIMQAQEAIVRSESNRVRKALGDLARAAPNPDFWKIDKVTMRPYISKTSGKVEYRAEHRVAAEDKDYTVSWKEDGAEHRLTLNRNSHAAVDLARALKGLGTENVAGLVKHFGTINRYLSHVNTTLNPEFVIMNAFRDLQTAGFNLKQFDVPGIVKKTLGYYPGALKGAVQANFKKGAGTEWVKWYNEFREAGGRVYFNRADDVGAIRNDMLRQLNEMKPGVHPLRTIRAIGRMVENLNMGVENGIRLAAYRAARESGMSQAEAASLAKNLTVNFNRRGSYGPLMNSLYLFFNASVQGSATILTALKSKRVQQVVMGAVVLGALLEMLGGMSGDADDDGELFYDKIPAFDKSRNLIFMDPTDDKGRYFKIPLPYGYNVFYAMGRALAEVYRGKDALESASNVLVTAVDSFNPVGGASNLLNMIAPTVVDPLVDLMLNQDYAGRPIAPEAGRPGQEEPNSQRYWGNVSPTAKWITDNLNALTQGDDVRPGKIDISPEWLDYMFGTVTGAAGTFYQRNADTVARLFDPAAEFNWNDIPVARRLVGEKPAWVDKGMFYERAAEAQQALKYVKDYAKRGEGEKAKAYIEEERNLIQLSGAAAKIREGLVEINHAKAAAILAHQMGKMDAGSYKRVIERTKAAEDKLISTFNKLYLEKRGTLVPARPGGAAHDDQGGQENQAKDDRAENDAGNVVGGDAHGAKVPVKVAQAESVGTNSPVTQADLEDAIKNGDLTKMTALSKAGRWTREDAAAAAQAVGRTNTARLIRGAPLTPAFLSKLNAVMAA